MKYITLFTDDKGTETWLSNAGNGQWGYTHERMHAKEFTGIERAARKFAKLIRNHELEVTDGDTVEFVPVNN